MLSSLLLVAVVSGAPPCLECDVLKIQHLQQTLKIKATVERQAVCKCEDQGQECRCTEGECGCVDCPTQPLPPLSQPWGNPVTCLCSSERAEPMAASVDVSTIEVKERRVRGRGLFRRSGGGCHGFFAKLGHSCR
jgi:hypothetical protein